MKRTRFPNSIIVFTGFLILPFLAMAAWQAPTTAAPGGGIASPVNVSEDSQDVGGSLSILGNFTAGNGSLSNPATSITRLLGAVGIGSYFGTNALPGDVAIDVAGNAYANNFCLRDSTTGANTGVCFSGGSVGTGGGGSPSNPIIQDIYPGTGILFTNLSGGVVTSIGVGSVSDGIISRDFTANPCPSAGSNIFLNSIDPNGATTCASPPATPSGLTSVSSSDQPVSITPTLSNNIYDLSVQGSVIQGTVTNTCGAGQVIGGISAINIATGGYQNVDITCTPVGYSSTNYCYLSGRTFYCVNNGVTTSIDIP